MIGGTMRSKLSLAALLAAGTVMGSAVSAQAADFGGDCCADLEERVAVLEATTARKGNRKVSLKIYGHVNQALLFWDDGVDSDTYVVDNDHRSTRIGFKGKAKINSDWSTGYKIELQFESSSSASVEQDDSPGDDGDDADAIGVRKSFMYVKSKTLGKLSWGLNSVATDDVTHDGFVSKTTDHARPDWHYNRAFQLRDADAGANGAILARDIGDLCGADLSDNDACFDIGSRRNSVRYDTPTFAGFKVSAAWGENDFWDVALRYAGEFGDIKVKAAIGYHDFDGDTIGGGSAGVEDREETSWAGSAGIIHTPTGLFVQGSYRNIEVEDPTVGAIPEADVYYLQAGIKQKWNSLGATAIWGEYANAEDGYFTARGVSQANGDAAAFGGTAGDNILSTEMERWGFGISQWVDAAKMQLYVIYQHTEIDVTTDGDAANLEDFDNVVVGGSIRF